LLELTATRSLWDSWGLKPVERRIAAAAPSSTDLRRLLAMVVARGVPSGALSPVVISLLRRDEVGEVERLALQTLLGTCAAESVTPL
jgi:hypothetical protein